MSLYSTPATKRGESPTERGLAIIEAAGLALAVLLPSFFNARSTFSFEPDRMALLRVLAIVVAVAGLLTISIRRPRLTPLRLAVIGWLAIQGIATLASVSVGRSFWGSEERVGGLLTSVAWALFALCLPVILSAGAVYRLVAAISLGSVPVTLYALAQEIGWDPVRVAVAPAQPPPAVSSTLGNPVFLGGYLAMVIPLTIWLAWSGQRKVAPIALAVLQMIALIGTEARGPWLGLAAGGVTAMLLIGLATARRRWIAASLAALALGIALLVAPSLALRPESMESLRRTPYVGRLAGLWTSTTAAQRLLIWEGAARLVASDPLRALVGYGPETLPLAYARHYPPRLAEYVEYLNRTVQYEVFMFDVQVDASVQKGNEQIAEVMYRVLLRSLDYAEDYDIAELEIELEHEGRLAEFERLCREIYREEWRRVRKGSQKYNRASVLLHTLDPRTYPGPESWLDAVRSRPARNLTVSQFIERSFDLCARRRPGKAIAFIVDEMGQYVARSQERLENLVSRFV